MKKTRLEELYNSQIRPNLKKELGLNFMEVPKISKIVLNVGCKSAISDSKVLNDIVDVLGKIAGQAPVKTIAKKSIAGFKLREGMSIGAMVTLRKSKMYEFLDRLINLALPAERDFQGVKRSFDRAGNLNLGIREWIIFPEVDFGVGEKVFGLNITINTTAKTDEAAYELLKGFGMPFRKENKTA
ncbi:MAG: 50S ribosomal protein L5 [candidate division TM6 bacterium GW2011_GWF2_32_72]|nr:MAG: 50S ribosomal protein L5 [candidate division TM6 bacterium GW2011_GWF2_32_72]